MPQIKSILFFLIIFFSVRSYAQEIAGDTIFINTGNVISIDFPARIFRTYNSDSGRYFSFVLSKNNLKVQSVANISKCSSSIIAEAKRTHSIFFCYSENRQKNINYYNLSTIKRLKAFINKTYQQLDANNQISDDTISSGSKTENIANSKSNTFFPDNEMKEANAAYEKEDYLLAKIIYQRLLLHDSLNKTAIKKLHKTEKIISSLVEKYTKKADDAELAKDFDNAEKYNRLILTIDPENMIASSKIALLTKNVAKKNAPLSKPYQNLEQYRKEMQLLDLKNTAARYYNNKIYDSAIVYYKTILTLNSYDPFAKNRVDEINDILLKRQEKLKEVEKNNQKIKNKKVHKKRKNKSTV